MIKKFQCLCKTAVVAVLALWCLRDSPALVSGNMVAFSQQNLREAKTQQDADRRATEILRLQILSDSATKFDQQQRSFGNSDNNYSWNQRYRRSASLRQQQ